MATRGKRYLNSLKKVDNDKLYTTDEAVNVLKSFQPAKFDETVEVAFCLGVDPKHADQQVRGAVVLPHGTGKKVKIAVFADGEKAKEAKEAGADIVGGEDLVQKVLAGFVDFDKVIATNDMMKFVGKLGKVLGPRGLMPNPRVGTVTNDIQKAVQEAKAGKIEFRVDKEGNLHAPIGKISFNSEHLKSNLQALAEMVVRLKPAAAKGVYMRAATLSSTMSPAVTIDVSGFSS